jgi:tetratricopeptide (TPR) repeat protein
VLTRIKKVLRLGWRYKDRVAYAAWGAALVFFVVHGILEQFFHCYRVAIIFSVMSVVMMGIAIVPSVILDEATQLRKRGDAAMSRKEYAKAVERYSRALRLHARMPFALWGRAMAYHCLGNREAAELDYTAYLALRPSSARGYYFRGNCFVQTKKLDAAIRDYTRAVELDPKMVMVWVNLGHALGVVGELDEAVAHFTKAIELAPELAEAWGGRGYALSLQGKDAQAIEDYDHAIQLEPKNVWFVDFRGYLHWRHGDPDLAIKDLTRAVELAPNSPAYYCVRAWLYRQIGDLSQSLADYGHALTLNPEYGDALNGRASIYCLLGQYEEARRDVEACRRAGGNVWPDLNDQFGPGGNQEWG